MGVPVYVGNDTNAIEALAEQIDGGGGGGGITDAPDEDLHARRAGAWVKLNLAGYVRLLPDAITTKTVGTAPGSDFADYAAAALWAQQHIGQALVLVLTSNIAATEFDKYEFGTFSFVGIQSNGFTSPSGLYKTGSYLALLDPFTATGTRILQFYGLTIVDEMAANIEISRVGSTENVQLFDAGIKSGFSVTVAGTTRTQCFNCDIGGAGSGITTSGHLWLQASVVLDASAADCSMHANSVIRGAWKPTAAISPSIEMSGGSVVGMFDYSDLPDEVETFATFSGFVSVGSETDPTGKYENLLAPPYVPNALSPFGIFAMASRPMP